MNLQPIIDALAYEYKNAEFGDATCLTFAVLFVSIAVSISIVMIVYRVCGFHKTNTDQCSYETACEHELSSEYPAPKYCPGCGRRVKIQPTTTS